MMLHNAAAFLGLCITTTTFGLVVPVAAQAPSSASGEWVVPRTPDGHPDLQGNWSSATLTPLQRPVGGQGPVLTPEEVQRIEQGQADIVVERTRASDPDRAPPVAGGTNPVCIDGPRTCYNGVYFDRGERVAVVDGEPRSSVITHPADGRVPSFTPEARERMAESRELRGRFGPSDHPEVRPLADRCLLSFGSNAGPPMLPNGFYNNNYTIVQTADHVLIMAEMVHDARIIQIGDGPRLPAHIRPWLGDSWGHWEGDVLVVETTNIHPLQRYSSESMKVIERFSRVDEATLHYDFTVSDPQSLTRPWTAQIPMTKSDEPIYEYACHEGNYGMEGTLSGARAIEKAARTGSR